MAKVVGEGENYCMQIRNMKLVDSLLDSKFVLTLEFHDSLDWKLQSLPNYTPRHAHATLQFLASIPRGDSSLKRRMHLILVIISTITVLMTTFAHKTTCTQFGNHWPPPHWLWHHMMFTIYMGLVYVIVPDQTRH